MKISEKHLGTEYQIEVLPDEYGTIRIVIGKEYVVLPQVTALSLARIIEEQVKELRRR